MPILGITGGVATGKTTFSHELQPRLGADLFDSDGCARELLASDPGVRSEVAQHFGASVFASDGAVDRARLREAVFRDESERLALQQILHPRIRAQWTSLARSARIARQWLIVDIPLLFETNAEHFFDTIAVVASSREVQRRRLLERRALDERMAAAIVAAQLDLTCKIEKSHHVVWNDSSLQHLRGQAILFAGYLFQAYG